MSTMYIAFSTSAGTTIPEPLRLLSSLSRLLMLTTDISTNVKLTIIRFHNRHLLELLHVPCFHACFEAIF